MAGVLHTARISTVEVIMTLLSISTKVGLALRISQWLITFDFGLVLLRFEIDWVL